MEIQIRSAPHKITVYADIDVVRLAPGVYGAGVSSGSVNARVDWERSDFKGNPFFEDAWGPLFAQVDDVNGTLHLKGALPEFFHDNFVVMDLTVKRTGDAAPFVEEWVETPLSGWLGAGAGAGAGVAWLGDAAGSISSSLGSLPSARGQSQISMRGDAGAGAGL